MKIYHFLQRLINCKSANLPEKIKYWANRLEFDDFLNCDINTLNSTTLNKISFARVMLHNPEIILIDDFTASMDLYDQTLVFEIIKEIKNDKSILFATNDLELSEFYSDRNIT